MRILQVMAGAEHGGAETAFVDMCLALKEAGEAVEVVTRANEGRVPRLEQARIKVHTLPFGGTIDLYTPFRMRQIIRAFKPEIVQTWMSRGCARTPRWSPSSGAPPYLVVARLGGYYKIKYFKSADYFTTITPDIKRHLVENGVEDSRVQHINNFAETEEIVTPLDRAAFGTPEDATLVLGLGRLHTAKAFDTLIEAVAGMENIHLWIAGEGPQRAELESLIERLHVRDRVKLLGWREDRAALLQACDICFFSSRYEPFGTVFVQAWAAKTPLITTSADGPRQFVRDGVDGLMVGIDDIEAFRGAIGRLARDQNLANTLIKNGYQRYEGEFTKPRCVAAYLAFYKAIISRESAARAA